MTAAVPGKHNAGQTANAAALMPQTVSPGDYSVATTLQCPHQPILQNTLPLTGQVSINITYERVQLSTGQVSHQIGRYSLPVT